jgi:hypothetical protein
MYVRWMVTIISEEPATSSLVQNIYHTRHCHGPTQILPLVLYGCGTCSPLCGRTLTKEEYRNI